MRAIQVRGSGKDAVLELGEVEAPSLRSGELRIDVCATAVNRADLLQARGLYPPPRGASPVLGLECAGTVSELGPGVSGFELGERVMALLGGGGYAEQVAVAAGSVLRIPERIPTEEAAGIPEVFLTCHLNLFRLAGAEVGSWVLVHGGGSGIGTAAIQLLREAGLRSVVTAGSDQKCRRCRELGADIALDYRDGSIGKRVLAATGGEGVEVVLDSIGAPYLADHLECLSVGGRLVLIGLMGGAAAELQLGTLLMKRLSLIGSTLRTRPLEEKAAIVRSFEERFGEALAAGRVGPVIDRVLPLARAEQAHRVLEASEHFGKIVLRVS